MRAVAFIIIVAFVFCAIDANAATFWVNRTKATCSDTYNRTQNTQTNAWCTITKAVANLSNNDIVYVVKSDYIRTSPLSIQRQVLNAKIAGFGGSPILENHAGISGCANKTISGQIIFKAPACLAHSARELAESANICSLNELSIHFKYEGFLS